MAAQANPNKSIEQFVKELYRDNDARHYLTVTDNIAELYDMPQHPESVLDAFSTYDTISVLRKIPNNSTSSEIQEYFKDHRYKKLFNLLYIKFFGNHPRGTINVMFLDSKKYKGGVLKIVLSDNIYFDLKTKGQTIRYITFTKEEQKDVEDEIANLSIGNTKISRQYGRLTPLPLPLHARILPKLTPEETKLKNQSLATIKQVQDNRFPRLYNELQTVDEAMDIMDRYHIPFLVIKSDHPALVRLIFRRYNVANTKTRDVISHPLHPTLSLYNAIMIAFDNNEEFTNEQIKYMNNELNIATLDPRLKGGYSISKRSKQSKRSKHSKRTTRTKRSKRTRRHIRK
jgi:hypothetical protein